MAHLVFRLYVAQQSSFLIFNYKLFITYTGTLHNQYVPYYAKNKFVLTFPVAAFCDLVTELPNCTSYHYVVLCDYSSTTQYKN